MSKKRIINSDDDTILWQKVISQVTPLKSTLQTAEFLGGRSNVDNHDEIKPSHKIETHEENIFHAEAPYKAAITINPVDLRNGERAGIDGRTHRRLFRGEVKIDSKIDLHGLTLTRAQEQLTRFIESTAFRGCRCVLVITGKGAGVLKRHAPDWLKRPPLAVYVLALAEARSKDGGSGALYVLLRRKRKG